MGMLTKFRAAWKAAETKDKIDLILDIVCGLGSGIAGGIASRELGSKARNKFEGALISVAMCGLGMAAGDVAKNALMKNVGEPLAVIINKSKEKKEETTNA